MENNVKRPQDDVPVEVILHYIVKDYRRMYKENETLLDRIEDKRKRIKGLTAELRKRQVASLTDKETKNLIESLAAKADRISIKLDAVTEERDSAQSLCERLSSQIDSMKESRNAIVEDVTSDLKEKLEAANDKIMLLAQAVNGSEITKHNILRVLNISESEDNRKWMEDASKQLEKAALQLLAIEERINEFREYIGDNNPDDTKRVYKRLSNALSRIESCISHIECFFDKVGNLKIVDNEDNTIKPTSD